MNPFILLLMIFFLIFDLKADSINLGKPSSIKDQTFLLTFPRSGTNWTAAILQAFFNRPIEGEGAIISKNRLDLDFSSNIPIIYRTHYANQLVKINQNTNSLILILRNYRECIAKLLKDNEADFSQEILNDGDYIRGYIANLNFYDKWAGKKLLIYYEDLIKNPQENIPLIIGFFNDKPELTMDDFFNSHNVLAKRGA